MSDGNSQTNAQCGKLYVVATPIGNLEDLSERAIGTLKAVSFIAAEDTRHSRKLLQHFRIQTPLTSYHDHSSEAEVRNLLRRVSGGCDAAVISDAGTPLVCDPGYRLVRLAREAGIPVIPIPGASALLGALSVAGLPCDRFAFEGFLPAKVAARKQALKNLASEQRTLIFYESPRRIAAVLADMQAVFGEDRQIFLARELTKKFEQHYFGNVGGCQQWLQAEPDHRKGEFVLVLRGAEDKDLETGQLREALDLVAMVREDLPLKKAVKLVSRITGIRKNRLYEAALASSLQVD